MLSCLEVPGVGVYYQIEITLHKLFIKKKKKKNFQILLPLLS